MRTGWLNLTTLVAMLIHSIFGCCWHHQHGAVDGSESHREVQGSLSGVVQCCHEHHGQTVVAHVESPSWPDNHNGCNDGPEAPCREADCVFLTADVITLPLDGSCRDFVFAVGNPAFDSQPAVAFFSRSPAGSAEPADCALLRALHQIWRV